MLSTAAKLFGVLFLLIGALGFLPAATPNNHLLGIFHVNTVGNVIHLTTGGLAILAGFTNNRVSKVFFLISGVFYGLMAFLGFMAGDRPLLGVIAHNTANAWLHVGIAAVSVAMGVLPEHDTSYDRDASPV